MQAYLALLSIATLCLGASNLDAQAEAVATSLQWATAPSLQLSLWILAAEH